MHKAIMALALALAGCGNRTLDLPARAPELFSAVEASQDAPDLSRKILRMGYFRVSTAPETGPVRPAPPEREYRWTPQTSDRLIMFWRIYTEPPAVSANGTRVYRIRTKPRSAPRTLSLDEPPLLAELAKPGDALAARGKWREAGRAWESARRQAPTLPLLHARLGDCHTALGEYLPAFVSYSKAVAMGGPHPDIFSAMGEMFGKFGKPRDAEDSFEKSAGLDPDNPGRWARLARSQFRHGKTVPALASANRALAMDPGNTEALALKALMEQKQ